MAISVSFSFSWAAQPLRALVFSTASYLQLVWSPNSLFGAWGLPLLGADFLYHIFSPKTLISKNSLPHLVSNWFNFMCTQLYNSSPPTQSPPITGHRAEITVMQFTGHSLPVHQFVTVPWDFNLVPYCQPRSPTPMEYALPPSLKWHVWSSSSRNNCHAVHRSLSSGASICDCTVGF